MHHVCGSTADKAGQIVASTEARTMTMKTLSLFSSLLLLAGCATSRPPLKTVEKVDLIRYMGPWYVIACIPSFIETEAYNAIEDYRLEADGSITTTFTFNQGAFDGPPKRYNPRGFVVDRVNRSTWGMQFIWPFKAEFLITYLTPDYSQTVIGRNKRDYCWIMARTPQIPEGDYQRLLAELASQGYDLSKLRKVPQRRSEPR
jgi:apolipoprotein D and lipocalin family protein